MRPSFHYREIGIQAPRSATHTVLKMLFLRLLQTPRLEVLFTIDQPLYEYVRGRYQGLRNRLLYLADPAELVGTETKAEARTILKLPPGNPILLVFGRIDARKGITELLAAVEDPRFPRNLHLLLAGEHSPDTQQLLQSPPGLLLKSQGRLHSIDAYLSDSQQYLAFRASDFVWLGYRGHSAMSGVLVQAAHASLPVVSCNTGLLGYYVNKESIGTSFSSFSPSAVAAAISHLLDCTRSDNNFRDGLERFSRQHSLSDFATRVAAAFP
jgi:glycosyltransferase involved in cell wall biosynthesis